MMVSDVGSQKHPDGYADFSITLSTSCELALAKDSHADSSKEVRHRFPGKYVSPKNVGSLLHVLAELWEYMPTVQLTQND